MAIAGPGQLNTRESPTCGSRSVHCFENLDKIGEGTYGQVYKAREIKTGEIVALKKIRMDNEREGFPITAIREIKLLKKLHHENVINLKEIVTSPPDGGVYMVFNYMDHDLAGLAKRPGMKFSVPQIKCYMRQLLTGLHYCHVNRVLHRDIKGANLLIDNEGNLKLADFGLSRSFSNDQNRNLTNNVITYWYRPPELLLGTTKYGPAVDMWSVGCVFAELLHGKPILPGKDEPEQASRIWELCGAPDENIWPGVTKLPWYNNLKPRRPLKRRLQEVFKHFDPHALELLEKMLTLDPDKRISAKDALDAEYFWIDPLPCDPKSLPKYEASHEFQTNKKRQQQRQHDEVAKRQKIQHQQQQHSCIPPPMQPQQQQQQHSRIPPPMQQQQHLRIPPPMQQQQHSRIPPPMQQQSRQAHTQMRPGLPNAPMHGSQPPLVAGGGGPGHHYGKSLGGPSGGSNRYPQGGNPSGGGYNHHPNRGSGPYPPSQAYGRSTGGNSSYAGGPPNYLQGSRSYNGAGRPGGGRDNARGQQYNNGH